MGKMIIYQVLPRLWGKGKFSEFDSETMSYFKSLGVSHVWYTGVIRHATTVSAEGCPASDSQIVKGAAGSPYAITDYYDVNPYLADNPTERMTEFEALLKRSHDAGLKVIIDFVPNHVSRDHGKVGLVHPEIKPLGSDDDPTVHWRPENDFYYYPGQPLRLPFDRQTYYENPAKASGNCFSPSPSVNDWYETIRLNYCDFHTETWDRMYEIVRYWCGKGVDGFRCDMVEMVPWQFFQWLTGRIKTEFPDMIFIAEVYQKGLYSKYINEVGFDFLYDKSCLYDSVRAVVEGHGTTRSLTWNWQFLGDLQPRMLNFLENHDEQRIASAFFAGDARKALPALAVSAMMGTSAFMVYAGQEIGEPAMEAEGFSGSDGRTTIFDYWSVASLRKLTAKRPETKFTKQEKELYDFYRRVVRLCRSERALADGNFYDLQYANYERSHGYNCDRQYAFMRQSKGGQTLLIVANFDAVPIHAGVVVPAHAFEYLSLRRGLRSARCLLSGQIQTLDFKPDTPLYIDVPAYGAVVLEL